MELRLRRRLRHRLRRRLRLRVWLRVRVGFRFRVRVPGRIAQLRRLRSAHQRETRLAYLGFGLRLQLGIRVRVTG